MLCVVFANIGYSKFQRAQSNFYTVLCYHSYTTFIPLMFLSPATNNPHPTAQSRERFFHHVLAKQLKQKSFNMFSSLIGPKMNTVIGLTEGLSAFSIHHYVIYNIYKILIVYFIYLKNSTFQHIKPQTQTIFIFCLCFVQNVNNK